MSYPESPSAAGSHFLPSLFRPVSYSPRLTEYRPTEYDYEDEREYDWTIQPITQSLDHSIRLCCIIGAPHVHHQTK